ncbi:outer membrane protein [Pelagibacterium montanilacus]|uniref:outer membrane protein n=1 Tax=Pelagibacterium montanilacus TaxID=2185280 RepID=UPI000F8CDE8D|nr:outer membrane beta-barrel protein [Pelagibacterium montanilacus]
MRLSSLWLAAAASSALCTAAYGADPIIEAPVVDAAQPVAFDWTGGYVGVFAGIARAQTEATDLEGVEFDDSDSYTRDGLGGFGGLTLGYNFQHGSLVFGPELEAGYLSNQHLWQDIDQTQNQQPAMLTEYGPYAVAAGRAGFASDGVLFYGKAGGVLAHIRSGAGEFDGVGSEDEGGQWGFDGEEAGYGESARFGWALGGGVEMAVDANLSFKAEYLYMNFGTATYDGEVPDESPFTFDDDLHTAKIGLNYSF